MPFGNFRKVVPGGIKKVRLSRPGMGKRGGMRIVYYYYDHAVPLFLLYAYPKNVQENLTDEEKKALRDAAQQLKRQFRQLRGGGNP